MSESNPEEVDVDLSPDDDATLDEMDAEADGDTPPEMTTRPDEPDEPEQSPAEAVDEEVKQRLANADGDTHAERAETAAEEAIEALQSNSQQFQQLKQQKQQAENRIERLEMTKGRVHDQRPEYDVVQTLAGGISLEVPHDDEDAYDRKDLINEIDETIEALEEKVESLEGQVDSLEESLQQTQAAAQELQKSSGYMEALGE